MSRLSEFAGKQREKESFTPESSAVHLLISIIVQIIFVTKYFHFWAYKKK